MAMKVKWFVKVSLLFGHVHKKIVLLCLLRPHFLFHSFHLIVCLLLSHLAPWALLSSDFSWRVYSRLLEQGAGSREHCMYLSSASLPSLLLNYGCFSLPTACPFGLVLWSALSMLSCKETIFLAFQENRKYFSTNIFPLVLVICLIYNNLKGCLKG